VDNKLVKDKHIRSLSEDVLLAVVVYYQDTPSRDEDEPEKCECETLKDAQKWLLGFPRDVWDGFERHDDINRELDKVEHDRTRIDRQDDFDFECGSST